MPLLHNIQHNVTKHNKILLYEPQHNDTQHYYTQNRVVKSRTFMVMMSLVMLNLHNLIVMLGAGIYWYLEYEECCIVFIVILSVPLSSAFLNASLLLLC